MVSAVLEGRRFARDVVVTPHYLASSAGLEVLAGGGNAVDAAIAANLALGVVAPYFCGVGGDLLALVHDGSFHAYQGVGRAPAGATVDVVAERAGSAVMPVLGAHSVTVPGAVEAWFALLERWGTRSFGELARTAIHHAREGFPLTAKGAEYLGGCHALYREFPDWCAAYPETRPGGLVRQPALARTLEAIADGGPPAFYEGPIADAVVEALASGGSTMTTDDLARHAGAWVAPIRATFAGVEVVELPPPTQGVTVLEALRILDGLDLGGDGPDRQHLLLEAVKVALCDRDDHVADPDAMRIGVDDLLDDAWIAARRASIDPARARRPRPRPGPDGGTAYLCAADAQGLSVSLIQSNFTAAGSGVHVRDWGVNLHNRGSAFRLDPVHVQAIGPSRLPMHTLVPATACRDGEPWLVFGTMGGHGQAQTQVQVLARAVLDGADPQVAIDAPRWVVDPGRWTVTAESRFDHDWLRELRARGHFLQLTWDHDTAMGHAHAIERTPSGFLAGTDPRAEGAALGR
jgi:gamma-glutamyltranspeptidase/glutathione hydrolase